MLTIHSVVKNEPLLYYSIYSVYDYADKILLYDTGTNDIFCFKVLVDILKEDRKRDNKIIYKEIPVNPNEEKWSCLNIGEIQKDNEGKKTVGDVRKIQIDDTDTPFFMILDGDEIYFNETIKYLKKYIKKFPSGKICGFVPLEWYYNHEYIFDCYSPVGRIFKTDKVYLNDDSPNEMHIDIETGKPININDSISINLSDYCIPYAHYEKFIKPWRRGVDKSQLKKSVYGLPEIIIDNPKYYNEYQEYRPFQDIKVKIQMRSNLYFKERWFTSGCQYEIEREDLNHFKKAALIEVLNEL